MKELLLIQEKLKAPKGQYNTFGDYHYRSCEDILEAVKPLLKETSCTLTISDEVIQVGDWIYVKATVTLTNASGEMVFTSASARETETRKKMDSSQLTGAASSYARKYALGGLFLLDDTKDADGLKGEEPAAKPAVKVITDKQASKIHVLIAQYEVDEKAFCTYFKIKTVEEMPVSSFDKAVKMLEAKGLVG